jgi:hypothetical protein
MPKVSSAARWLLLAAASSGVEALAQGESSEEQSIHWAYAAYFGTGHYDIGDLEDVYAVRAGLRRDLRAAALTEDRRRIGATLRVPITVGLHDFGADNELSNVSFDSVGTVSAVPGVEIAVPVTERWSIKPFGYLGWGSDLDGSASAWIYWAGVKSRRSFGAGPLEWAVVNALTYVGYKPRGEASAHIVPFLTGLEFERPLANTRIGGERVQLHWHVAYTRYLNDLTFDTGAPGAARIDIGSEWEAGVAFGKEGGRLRLWKLSWDRFGLAYRVSSNGEFTGIKVLFRSLFDR